jgi:hypothetical protein
MRTIKQLSTRTPTRRKRTTARITFEWLPTITTYLLILYNPSEDYVNPVNPPLVGAHLQFRLFSRNGEQFRPVFEVFLKKIGFWVVDVWGCVLKKVVFCGCG